MTLNSSEIESTFRIKDSEGTLIYFFIINHRRELIIFIQHSRNIERVVACQQMGTTWANQLSLLIQFSNDSINEILKPIQNKKKFSI